MNSYCGAIYLDSREDISVPSNCLFIRHQIVCSLEKLELSDAQVTAKVLAYFMGKGVRKQLKLEDYKKAVECPLKYKMKYEPKSFVMGS